MTVTGWDGKQNRSRAFDCGFVSLMSATTIAAVMSTECEIRAKSVPGRPKGNKKEDLLQPSLNAIN